MYLNNIIVDRPKGTKLCPSGKAIYVYHVVETVYNPIKKYNIDKRVSVGKLVEGSTTQMIPNERFKLYYPEVLAAASELPEPPQFSQTLHVGAVAAEREIAVQLGIHKILSNIYGEAVANEIMDVITYVLTEESAAFQHFPTFMREHLPSAASVRSDSYISSTLLHKEITSEKISEMLRQWNKKNCDSGKIYIGCDSTNFNTEASHIQISDFGAAKDDPSEPQVNLAVAVKQSDTTPLFYDLFPGSIIDLTECEQLVEQMRDFGYRDIGLLFDRGYFSETNIKMLDDMGYDFMMMMREDYKFVRNIVKEHAAEIKDNPEAYISGMETFGITFSSELYGKNRWFHVYFDEVKASYAKRRFLNSLAAMKSELSELQGNTLRKNINLSKYKPWFEITIDKTTQKLVSFSAKEQKIADHLLMYGFFVIMTSEAMDSETALFTYRGRDNIEKFFRGIKSGMDFDSPGVHDDKALAAKIHLMFIAGIIRNRLVLASNEIKKSTGNKKSFTVPAIIDQLNQIECTAFEDGVYRRRYALTAKQKLILDTLKIRHEIIDEKIANFNEGFSKT